MMIIAYSLDLKTQFLKRFDEISNSSSQKCYVIDNTILRKTADTKCFIQAF